MSSLNEIPVSDLRLCTILKDLSILPTNFFSTANAKLTSFAFYAINQRPVARALRLRHLQDLWSARCIYDNVVIYNFPTPTRHARFQWCSGACRVMQPGEAYSPLHHPYDGGGN